MTLLNAFKKENRSIHKCPACGMDLNFSEDTLLRMVACPFCAARIDLKEVLQRTEISYVSVILLIGMERMWWNAP